MDFAQLRKLEKQSLAPRGFAKDQRVTGIVKVATDGYRPPHVHVRADIGARIFTADFLASDLAAIEADPQVQAVSISTKLPLQKLPKVP